MVKKVIAFDECNNTHDKLTIFYLFICRFYLRKHISLHLESYMCYKYKTYIIQLYLRTPNPRQIIAEYCQNADERVRVEQPPLLNWSTIMAVAVTITVTLLPKMPPTLPPPTLLPPPL